MSFPNRTTLRLRPQQRKTGSDVHIEVDIHHDYMRNLMYNFLLAGNLGNFRQRYVQTGSKDHATYSLTQDPSSIEHRAYRLCHYHVGWSHGPITTEHPILSSQRGRVSEVTPNAKAQRTNSRPFYEDSAAWKWNPVKWLVL